MIYFKAIFIYFNKVESLLENNTNLKALSSNTNKANVKYLWILFEPCLIWTFVFSQKQMCQTVSFKFVLLQILHHQQLRYCGKHPLIHQYFTGVSSLFPLCFQMCSMRFFRADAPDWWRRRRNPSRCACDPAGLWSRCKNNEWLSNLIES